MMNHLTILLPLIVFGFVFFAIWGILNRKDFTKEKKTIWIIAVLIIPVIAIPVYYFQTSSHYSRGQRDIRRKVSPKN